MLAREVRGQLVVHGHHVAASRPWVVLLVRLVLAALGIAIVPPGELGIDRTVDAIAVGARERVLVKTLLGDDAVGVFKVRRVAHEELQVTLQKGRGVGARRLGVYLGGDSSHRYMRPLF